MEITNHPAMAEAIRRALAEDIGTGDATTLALVPESARVHARIVAREACTVAGGPVARLVFDQLAGPALTCQATAEDGASVAAGATLLTLDGPARAVLTGERTALNFMQRMCGIATLTRRFVDAVRPHPVAILDTRKTTPGLRAFEKYAVRCGGGENHRMGLYDRIMIKDNHRELWGARDPDRLDEAVAAARRAYPELAVEVEVESEAELRSAMRARPEWILLDNMELGAMARCVAIVGGRSRVEASGGITLERAAAVAATGVDAISLGCLTHSAASVDLSLEIDGA